MAEAVRVRKKKPVKSSSSGEKDKTKRPSARKSVSEDKQELEPVPRTLEPVSPTTPEIRIEKCESVDADSLSYDFQTTKNRPSEIGRHDTLEEVLDVEEDYSPTLPHPEREALDILKEAINSVDDTLRRDSVESTDSLEPLQVQIKSGENPIPTMESSVSYEVLDTPCDPTLPAPIYPNLASELIESDADGALRMGIEEMDYRNYLVSGSQPSEEDKPGFQCRDSVEDKPGFQCRDSVEYDFLHRSKSKDSRASEIDLGPENVFDKAFSDAYEIQVLSSMKTGPTPGQ